MPARRHRADEHAIVRRIGLHPDTVAEEGAAGDRRGRVHRHHRHGPAGLAQLGDQRRDERRLAGARRAGDSHQVGATRQRVEVSERVLGNDGVVLDGGQEPGE